MAFVSYSHNALCKTLAIPEITGNFNFHDALNAPQWQNHPGWVNDFHTIYSKSPVCDRVSFALLQDADCLYIAFKIAIPQAERRYQNPDSLWSGEMIELHFGAMAPDPWLLQLCAGINGQRFDSSGAYDLWQAEIVENADFWGGVIRISRSMMQISNCAVSFNFCGQLCESATYFTWTKLLRRFHEVENYGLLLFTDYANALKLRYGMTAQGDVDRSRFEKIQSEIYLPAQKITHGPYVTYESSSSAAVLWETAGMVPAFLEYYPADAPAQRKRILCDMENAVMKHRTNHYALLQNLKADTSYVYELFYLNPVSDTIAAAQISGTITMPSTLQDELDFYCVSDLHSDAGFLKCAMLTPEAQSSALKVLLGDNLSHAAGREALYAGAIDPIMQAGNTAPLIFVRGNHEQLGVFASEYFNVMPMSNGKSYRFARFGTTAFIILDSGSDNVDPQHTVLFDNSSLRKEQHEFLKKVVTLDEYKGAKARIVLMHIPPYHKDVASEVETYNMLSPLCNAPEKPHLMLCGHLHQYLTVAANATTYCGNSDTDYVKKRPEVMPLPFPSMVCSTAMALACRVSAGEITVRAMRPQLDNREIDRLTIKL